MKNTATERECFRKFLKRNYIENPKNVKGKWKKVIERALKNGYEKWLYAETVTQK